MTDSGAEVMETTIGRLQFNGLLPESFPYVNQAVNRRHDQGIVTQAIENEDWQVVTRLIDSIKDLGFLAATQSGLSYPYLTVK